MESDEYVECPQCWGWGSEPATMSQWEEDGGSLLQCYNCNGFGYIPLESGGEEIVV